MALIKLINIKIAFVILAALALMIFSPVLSPFLALIGSVLKFALLLFTKLIGVLSTILGSFLQILTLIINGIAAAAGYVVQHFILRYTNVGILPPIVTDILKSILGCFGFGKKFFKQMDRLSNSFTKNFVKNFKRKLF